MGRTFLPEREPEAAPGAVQGVVSRISLAPDVHRLASRLWSEPRWEPRSGRRQARHRTGGRTARLEDQRVGQPKTLPLVVSVGLVGPSGRTRGRLGRARRRVREPGRSAGAVRRHRLRGLPRRRPILVAGDQRCVPERSSLATHCLLYIDPLKVAPTPLRAARSCSLKGLRGLRPLALEPTSSRRPSGDRPRIPEEGTGRGPPDRGASSRRRR